MRASGVTLLELIVVLAVLGVILGVTGLALATLKSPREAQQLTNLRQARADAIHAGAARLVNGIRFLPDGRAIGPNVDPLTGVPNAK